MTAATESTRVSLEEGHDVRVRPALEPGRRHKESRSPNIADRYAVYPLPGRTVGLSAEVKLQ